MLLSDYGGIMHAPAQNDAVVMRYFHHPMMDCLSMRSHRQTPSPQQTRHLASSRGHLGEVVVHQVGAHLAFQGGIAQVPDVLEDQQT